MCIRDSISKYAFYNCTSLTSVTIPEGVTSIGDYAFYSCAGLTSVTIPEGVTSIGVLTFYNCSSLESITIPEGVTSIGEYAFERCTSLTSVTIPEGVTSIENYAFNRCTSLTSVTIPASVTSIGNSAFSDCTKLMTVTIPEGVTSIGDHAFSGCTSLASITIPASVTSIGNSAFSDCTSLTSITIPEGVTSIGDYTFYNCSSLTSVTIPEGVTSIGNSAFKNCTSLTSVTIPEGVTSIGRWAFDGCTSLKDVYYTSCSETGWKNITIGSYNDPFQKATVHYLEHQWNNGEITAPATCTEDGVKTFTCAVCKETKTEIIEKLGHAFGAVEVIKAPTCTETGISGKRCTHEGCDVIDSETVLAATGHTWDEGMVTTEPTYETDGIKTFTCSVCKATKTEQIPALAPTVVASGKCGHSDNVGGESSVTWELRENGVLTISGTGAMNDRWAPAISAPWYINREKILTVVIEDGVTSIGNYAFYSCSSLTSITIPESVTSIGTGTFYHCSRLTSLTIPKSVTDISCGIFNHNCGSLASLTVEEENPVYHSEGNCVIKTADKELTVGCKSSVIPTDGTVTSIGRSAFGSCPANLTLPESVVSISDFAFFNSRLASITIPNSVTSIGSYAFSGCSWLTEITIPQNVTTLNDSVFSGCGSLTSITIPKSVTSIGSSAFEECSRLTSVILPVSVTSIGDSAFYDCEKLTDVFYSGSRSDWEKITIETYNDPLQKANIHFFVTSGKCGDNLTWTLYEDGVLSITGTGSMYVFSGNGSSSDAAPWYSYRNEIKTVQIGDGATSIGDYAFAFCFYLADVTIPATVQNIGQNAFRTATALTNITIPEGVVSIGADAFLGGSLTSISLPSSVTSVGSSAFNGCTSLTSIEILGSITSMGMCAFQNCHKLTSVTIAEGTTVIGQYAFNCCDALPEITIPKSVTNIGEYAFNGCTSLKDVYYSSCSAGDWEKISAGSGIDSLQNITIHYLDHQLDDGKVTTEPTCEKNGEKTFTCAVCKETKTEIIEKLGHAFGAVEVIKAPTCTETGISGKRCQHEGCDVIDSETVLPATGHKWDDGKVTTEPTCTEDGVKTYTCSVCNETKTETITATGHKWDEGKVTTPATCTENGVKTFTCSVCKETKTETVEKLGHAFGVVEVIKAPTCTETGISGKRCTHEGCDVIDSETVLPATGHQWDGGEITTPATCTENGVKTYTCSVCKEIKTEAVEKLGHSFGAVEVIKAPTCTETGISGKRCQHEGCEVIDSETVLAATGHQWDDGKVATEPTYEKDGIKTFTCSVCKATKTETIPAPTPIASGTCGSADNESGESSVKWSLFEDGILIISGTGAMADWEYSEPAPWSDYRPKIKTVVINPGITVIGRFAFDRCTNLTNVTIPDSVTCIKFWAFHACGFTDITIPEGVERIESAFYECCELTSIVIPKSATSVAGIAFECCSSLASITVAQGNPVYHSDGNCLILTADKTLIAGCKNSAIPADGSVTRIDTSAFSGHTGLMNITIPNTVTSIGALAFMACSGLETILVAEGNPVYHSDGNCIIKTADKTLVVGCKNSVIPADGSVTSIGRDAFFACSGLTSITIPEGVTSIGGSAFWACTSLTDVYYSGCSEAKWNSITVGEQNDPLQNATVHYLEHQWDEGKVTTPATCTEDGIKTFTCSACKETRTETVEKLGHSFGAAEVIKAPTCTETGISGKCCQHDGCEAIDSETVLPANGHQWDNGKVTTEPTCTEDGVKTYTCSVCDETKTETITATGHQWDEGVVTSEPTYTENGEKTFTCVICRTTRTETIPALTPEPDSVDLNEIAKDFDGSSIGVDVDGKTVYPDGEGNYPRLTVPEGTTTLISVSTCNLPEGVDPHTRYPVGMAVYKATNTDGTTSVERISEMDDLLRYAGSSIRITGNKGIRLITGINASLKSALTSEGVAGYTLEEYGTLLCWASEVQNGSLSLSDAYARHNYAYSLANGTDPVFRYAGDVIQYTNVLVGFSNKQCVDDIAMRPYITLRDADGNTYTLYGGIVNRSIGYIAYQNRGAFTPGTNAYNYIWDIIHFVYGDAYDEDYKG